MKQIFFSLFLILVISGMRVNAQSHELSTLLINIEKLNQLRSILDQMRDGYRIIMNGYDKVKDITSGNFRIHDLFLDGLYLVSPEVKRYKKVADIINYQAQIVREYRGTFRRFSRSGAFSPDELLHLSSVYKRLFDDSLQHLDELLLVITARQLRMSDQERLTAIDRICSEMERKWLFLRSFNKQQGLLAISKLKEKTELRTLQGLHGSE